MHAKRTRDRKKQLLDVSESMIGEMESESHSLREYLVVAQDERRVHLCSRLNDKDWRIETIDATAGRVRLSSVDVELTLDQIYHGVNQEA